MNNPEYILVDEFGVKDPVTDLLTSGILFDVKTALGLPALNYQYGYVKELQEHLEQWGKSEAKAALKFPLVWIKQPFTVVRNTQGFFGIVSDLSMFVIHSTAPELKAKKRMTDKFKPVIYPIYREIINQIDLSPVFSNLGIPDIPHRFTDRYYWGEDQKTVIPDAVDVMEINFQTLRITNNSNCLTFKSFA